MGPTDDPEPDNVADSDAAYAEELEQAYQDALDDDSDIVDLDTDSSDDSAPAPDSAAEPDSTDDTPDPGGTPEAQTPEDAEPGSKDEATGDAPAEDGTDATDAAADTEVAKPETKTVPVARLSQVSREKRQAEAELRKTQDELREERAKLANYERQAAVHGVALSVDQADIDIKDPAVFAEISDEHGEKYAQLMLNQQLKLDAALAANAPPQGDAAGFTDEEIHAGIAANDNVHRWLTEYQETGASVEWSRIIELDKESPLAPNETAEKRYARLAKQVEKEITDTAAEAVKSAPIDDTAGPSRTLNNTAGSTSANDELSQLVAMGDGMNDYLDKLQVTNPAKAARLEGMLDAAAME